MANVLSLDKQTAVVSALVEGMSLRAVSRITGVHKTTIARLMVRVGEGCAVLHDRAMRNLRCTYLELDEAWSFIHKKQKKVKRDDPLEWGDQYTFIALDANHKAIVSYYIDKRDELSTRRFVTDLRSRVLGRPQITTDGWQPYVGAIEDAFGADVDYAMCIKDYKSEDTTHLDAARRYSPGRVEAVEIVNVSGNPDPDHISTSYVERQNLTVRMHGRRFTRLTNAFSKKLRNHRAAFDLHVAYYNFVRIHETLSITPALSLAVTDHVWSVRELVQVALACAHGGELPPRPAAMAPRLRTAADTQDVPGDQFPRDDPRVGPPQEPQPPAARPTRAPFLRIIDGEKGMVDDPRGPK